MKTGTHAVVGIYLFDQVELLDFAGPFEVFTTASRVARKLGRAAAFEVLAIGRVAGPVQARAGVHLAATHALHDHPALDLLVVPGGVVDEQMACAPLRAWLAAQAESVPLIASVCTGAFLLADAGLLRGCRATTHWEDVDDLARAFPDIEVVRGVRWVDAGSRITSAGIAAGIDMSLHIVARLCGRELARATARQMDYPWHEEADSGL